MGLAGGAGTPAVWVSARVTSEKSKSAVQVDRKESSGSIGFLPRFRLTVRLDTQEEVESAAQKRALSEAVGGKPLSLEPKFQSKLQGTRSSHLVQTTESAIGSAGAQAV